MKQIHPRKRAASGSSVRFEHGRIYFSKSAERRFFFILTLLMLIAGILFHLGIIR